MPSKPKTRTLLSWSSGKDSAWALHVLRQQEDVEIVGLLTTLNGAADRVAMHAVRRELVEAQANALALPLLTVALPWPCPNEAYEGAMQSALNGAIRELAITAVAFGDLFLEDVRAYREEKIAACGLEPLFPLWGSPTDELAKTMVENDLRAYLTCIDPRHLGEDFAGRAYDHELLEALPETVDPCGERGEFHTFAYHGPMFSSSISVEVGEVIERGGFVFADIVPNDAEAL